MSSLGLCGRYPVSGLELRMLGVPRKSWRGHGWGGPDVAWIDQRCYKKWMRKNG